MPDGTLIGAEIVNAVADHVRTDMLRNMGLADLLKPSSTEVALEKASELNEPLRRGAVVRHRIV
jgi:hypothetical protein